MIYVLSDKVDIAAIDNAERISLSDSRDLIESWPVVQFDTETTGLDAHISKLQCLQFGYKNWQTESADQIVVDIQSAQPEKFKHLLETKELIGHNLKFDLKFLYNFGIVPRHIYDTMICEQTLYLGYPPKSVSFKLSSVLERYTGIQLDKEYQSKIARSGLTPEAVVYAANDVVHLQDIRRAQLTIAAARNCVNAFTVENRFVPAIAYLEWCGVHLDTEKWLTKMLEDKAEFEKAEKLLNDYVISCTQFGDKYVSSVATSDLFQIEPTFSHECTINWHAPRQVIPLLQDLGFNTQVRDKETHQMKDSADSTNLKLQKGVNDEFLSAYLAYAKAGKNVSTYGRQQLNQVNPITDRIHTVFRQIGTTTGRMSCGDNNTANEDLARLKHLKKNQVTFCNLQNLPAKGEAGKKARACFTSMPGNVFISCDYSAEESRVAADVWNEKSLLDAFEQNLDTHNVYAKLCFPEELKDVDVRDVKKVRPDLRDKSKQAEFAVNYGSTGASFAKVIGVPKEKAKEIVQTLLKGMPGMTSFKKKTVKFLEQHGYLVINEQTGHRVYWPEWSSWKAVDDTLDQRFWADYSMRHKDTGDYIDKKVRAHKAMSYDWFNKNVLDYPIQGGSAIVLKQAAADFFDWVIRNNMFGVVLFCVFVHDEIDVECPAEMQDRVSTALQTIMERAAAKYYKKLKIPAELSIGDHWIH